MSTKHIKKATDFYNSFPDCVFVTPLFINSKGKVTISFTILFGERIENNTLIGEIRFGIKSGELVLDIENGEVDPREIEFMKEFRISTIVNATDENVDSQSKVRKKSQSLKGTISIAPSIDSDLGVYNESTTESGRKKTISFPKTITHVKANWHPTKPRWSFRNQIWETYLEGRINKQKFATVGAITLPLVIKYRFEIKPKDIIYTNVLSSLNTTTINKQAVLHAFITKIILKLQTVLSEGDYTYYG